VGRSRGEKNTPVFALPWSFRSRYISGESICALCFGGLSSLRAPTKGMEKGSIPVGEHKGGGGGLGWGGRWGCCKKKMESTGVVVAKTKTGKNWGGGKKKKPRGILMLWSYGHGGEDLLSAVRRETRGGRGRILKKKKNKKKTKNQSMTDGD